MDQIISSWVEETSVKQIDFTIEEKNWISNNKVLVGIEPWKPIIYYEDNKAKGFTGDILNLVIQKTGLNVVLVSDSWDSLLTDFKNKKVDLKSLDLRNIYEFLTSVV